MRAGDGRVTTEAFVHWNNREYRLQSELAAATAEHVLVLAAALVLSVLSTIYPSWRAARTRPAEALRYE